ncbi:MAG: glycosyltransferase family 4 protein [Candidatus Diapherotrites archaeon]
MEKFRVLHAVNHFSPCVGGVERITEQLCRELSAKGIECAVVCLDKCAYSREKLPKEEEANGVKVHRVPFLDLKYYKLATKALKFANGFDLVHVHGLGFFSDAFSLFSNKKVVINTHGGIWHTKEIGLLKKIYFSTLNRLALNSADAVIADSKSDYEIFKKICRKTTLLENGVDVNAMKKLRGKKNFSQFLFVGRLSKNKRIDLLLETFAELKRKGIGFRLVVAGEDWEHILPELQKIAREKGIEREVVFTGKVSEEELLELYRESGFFVSASRFEGFGISAVEAMAAGCVPLLHENESFRNFVSDGENGFLLDFQETEKSAEKIAGITGKSIKEIELIAGNAFSSVEKFGWEKKAGEYIALYKRVLGESA